ncbi:hypothetical protein [Azospirillum isscasi]|uniref:Uncharacterized protein n=1 Tax=Azospirillum isscasi TaxID=3053926 RepID=A0ABU0WFU1_9PROT|nr:hypothetical protein [Azospirillum isscasi]MDQ2103071.1 hypothetical protein [Azospirillum isscasi]
MSRQSGQEAGAAETSPDGVDSAIALDDQRWSWLAGTYWYVPEVCLPALRLKNFRETTIETVQDQTLWWFEGFDGGYLTGRAAISIDGGDFKYLTVFGSVTPDGDVLLSFSPSDEDGGSSGVGTGTDPLTTGYGRLTRYRGAWAFLMQMTSGTNAVGMTHWAYMVQATPDSDAWTSLPGVPGTGIGDVFS